MQLKVINSLICLYQEQNISKASAKLYISQQGLSRQIQVLENELNVSLFTRSNSGVEPTEICRVLYPHFKSIYDEYLASQDALENYRKKKNSAHTIAFAYGVANSVSSDFMNLKKRVLTAPGLQALAFVMTPSSMRSIILSQTTSE